VSPSYTPEQGERWHKRTCARCQRHGWFAARWPDGYVCRTCHDKALRIRGHCPGCGTGRALPGLRPTDHTPVCTDCAGFMMSYRCSRCGEEGKLHGGRLCTRCTFSDRLVELLDDGTGRIRSELIPLSDTLLAMSNPRSGLAWLDMRTGRPGSADDLLRRLSRGDIELTHEAFHTLQPWRAAAHLRELLMACEVLPRVDKQICLFERWLVAHIGTLTDRDHGQVIQRFATWEVLPRLRARAENKPITPSSRQFAGDQIKQATAFLDWLVQRQRTLQTCDQADIDTWHAEHAEHVRRCLRGFLLWSMASKLTRPLRLPALTVIRNAPLPQRERMALLGHLLTGQDLPLRSRVAGIIVLLYAQRVSRIVRLTIDDVICDGDQLLLRLGEPPSPVPTPFAKLLLTWISERDNMNTATNPDSRWLFPGRCAGQPMHPASLAALVNKLGVPTSTGRTAAIRQHLLEMPAPVVADALGYHPVTAAQIATQVGVAWSRYASDDHTRTDDS
jgi:integrase